MKVKMTQGGFNEGKLSVLCNFVDPVKLEKFAAAPLVNREDYYCYVGRLSHEKGVSTLLKAASQLPYKLKVAGDGPIGNDLREIYGSNPNIEFLGHCNAEEVSRLISSARFSVIPSEWYENNPLSVIESLCGGTPVIGADMGGIPELIHEGETGELFDAGNADSLEKALRKVLFTPGLAAQYSENCRNYQAETRETYYEKLMAVYGG
jgi:glycosyltransferase involved in cell wall biosynthesis